MKLFLTIDGRTTNPHTIAQAFWVMELARRAGRRIDRFVRMK